MPELSEPTPGTFCWLDLGTTDEDGAKAFYGAVFGWDYQGAPMGPDATYWMCQKGGKNVGALYTLSEEQRQMGIPPHWLNYIGVASAKESADEAKSLGATVIKEPFDVMGFGVMALVQDPTGAVVALWQTVQQSGPMLWGEPGSAVWQELQTNNVDRAGSFYTQLLGWTAQVSDMPSGPYTTFLQGEKMAGGMMAIGKEWGEVPPNWSLYFGCDNVDETIQRTEAAFGKVLAPAMDIPGVGRFAVLQDPQGAVFSIITMAMPAQS